MVFPLIELEHLKKLLEKTPYLQETRRDSKKEKRRQTKLCPKIRFVQEKLEGYNKLLSKLKTEGRVQN